MTTFDQREQAFEQKFEHDEELRFKARARRNKMLGLWAAGLIGKTGDAAEAYAYGGSIVQDLGYYPYGSPFFSDLTHYVRSGDFVAALLENAQDVDEYAFALGALAHYEPEAAVGHLCADVRRGVDQRLATPDDEREVGRRQDRVCFDLYLGAVALDPLDCQVVAVALFERSHRQSGRSTDAKRPADQRRRSQPLALVERETVAAWHRKGFRVFWTWKVRHGRPGRPIISREVRDLIRKMQDVSRESLLGCTTDPRGAANMVETGIA